MAERLFQPLGMTDTGFSVPAAKLDRLPPCYWTDPASGQRALFDEAGPASRFARAPGFPSGAGGLVSTADDLMAFGRMMLAKGRHGERRILSEATVEAMSTDQLTPKQRADSALFLEGRGWGLGMSTVSADTARTVPAGYGWDGGYGTSWRTDPAAGLVGVLLTQQVWTTPSPPAVQQAFWGAAYGA
jgi:CubicO group peptidase (beta-lactamase class C family)